MKMLGIIITFCLAWMAGLVCPAAGQEVTFENLEFDMVLNANLEKEDLVEKVVLIHLWGTT